MTTTSPRMLFVNLAVQDLEKSKDFFGRLGFGFDERFGDDKAACLVISDQAYAMLLVEPFFAGFTSKAICDTTTHVEVLLALSADSRDEVDQLVQAALEAGGSPAADKMEDGPMYGWSFQDLDGHVWEVFHMDPAAVPPAS
jgi:uncharacterized protein